MSKYDHPKNPFYEDFRFGMQDGTETNAYCTPGERTGEALQAYLEGFKSGQENMDQYYAEQE